MIFLKNGLVIPISLACKSPEILPDASLRLVLSEGSLPMPPNTRNSSTSTVNLPPAPTQAEQAIADLESEGGLQNYIASIYLFLLPLN